MSRSSPISLASNAMHNLLDELHDIWRTRNARTRIWLYQLDGFALACLTLGNCEIGDTLSSKAWQLDQRGRTHGRVFRRLIDWIFSCAEDDHCAKAYQSYLRIRNLA